MLTRVRLIVVLGLALAFATGCTQAPPDYVEQGIDAAAAGMVDEAERLFLRAVAEDESNLRGRLALGELYLRQGKWDESEAQYEAAAKVDPDHDITHLNLALLRFRAEDFPAALRHVDTALTNTDHERVRSEGGILRTATLQARTLRGEMLDLENRLKRDEDQPRDLKRLAEVHKAYATLFAAINFPAVAQRERLRARSSLQRLAGVYGQAETRDATNAIALADTLAELAWLCHENGEPLAESDYRAKCMQVLKSLFAGAPERQRAEAWYLAARMSLLTEDLDTATDNMQRAIDLLPREARFHVGLAELHERAGLPPQRRVPLLERAVGLEPDSALYRNELGRTLVAAGRADEARDVFREVLGMATDYQHAQFARRALAALDAQQTPVPTVAP